MGKFKGQGTLTKLITTKLAEANKNEFSKLIYNLKQIKQLVTLINCCHKIDLQIVGFSSMRDYPEQILSILSFIRYVGEPSSCIIYSDGSHTEQEMIMFETIFPFARIIKEDFGDIFSKPGYIKPSLKTFEKELIDFSNNHFLGKRLFLYLNYAIKIPTLFLDSDILFYKKADLLRTIIQENVTGWFLPDVVWGCLDTHYKVGREQEPYQLNAGFILMNKELSTVSEGLNFLKELGTKYEYFSEQTIMHMMARQNGFIPLDPRKFILNTADQFDFSYLYSREDIAIRHYTGPVRHKMWQRSWKWHLSLI